MKKLLYPLGVLALLVSGWFVVPNFAQNPMVRSTSASVQSIPTISSGAFASLPGTCTHTSTQSDIYFFTDSWWANAMCTATNTWSYWGAFGQGTPAGPASNWTAINSATAADDSAGDLVVTVSNNSTLNWRIMDKSVPGTPYTIDITMRCNQPNVSTTLCGAYFYDGTKLMGIESLSQNTTTNTPYWRVEKITNVTTDGSTPATAAVTPSSGTGNGFSSGPQAGFECARLSNNGTTLGFSYSLDCHNFTSLFTESVGTFITPTKYGIGGVSNITLGSGSPAVLIYSPSVYVH